MTISNNINDLQQDGLTLVCRAAQWGFDTVVKDLHSRRADVSKPSSAGHAPLHFACENGHTSTARTLIALGANARTCTSWGQSPLLLASAGGDLELMQLLYQSGGSINAASNTGFTPLMKAATLGRDNIVSWLIDQKAQVNGQNTVCSPDIDRDGVRDGGCLLFALMMHCAWGFVIYSHLPYSLLLSSPLLSSPPSYPICAPSCFT